MLPHPNSHSPSQTPRLSITALAQSLTGGGPSRRAAAAAVAEDDDPSSKKHRRRHSLIAKLPLPTALKATLHRYEAYLNPLAILVGLVIVYVVFLSSSDHVDDRTSANKEASSNPLLRTIRRVPDAFRLGLLDKQKAGGGAHQPLRWQPVHSIINWGDHVGLGRGRQAVLDHSPSPYNDLGDRVQVKGLGPEPWYRTRMSELSPASRLAWDDEMQRVRKALGRDPGTDETKQSGLGSERRGILGGASVEWSTGIIGSGVWLGDGVDMKKPKAVSAPSRLRKRGRVDELDQDVIDDDDDDTDQEEQAKILRAILEENARLDAEEAAQAAPQEEEKEEVEDGGERREEVDNVPAGTPREALQQHIIAHAWEYIDDEDRDNSEKLLSEAKENNFLDQLPLRDQVREDEEGRKDAAEQWSRIYAAADGQRVKSALEVQLEKLVRRVPIVVFSQTAECTPCQLATGFLKELNLSPEPYVIFVDQRPDQNTLKGLLARRTEHEGFPNIVIGGRSIGGAKELEQLMSSKRLAGLLEDAGVLHNLERRRKGL